MFTLLTENLKRLGYKVSVFKTAKEATEYLNKEIDGRTVGIGGSVTVDEMRLYPALSSHNTVYWHQGAKSREISIDTQIKARDAEVYISSVNGIAETGEIINIDGNCNRVASIMYGNKKVYLVVGKNKLAKDYDSALYRARNVAAPLNAKRLGRKTPCAAKGDKCYNCSSPERICRGLTVLLTKPNTCDYEIILIEENLGY